MALKTLLINNEHRYLINIESPAVEDIAISIINHHGSDCIAEIVDTTENDVKPKTLVRIINDKK